MPVATVPVVAADLALALVAGSFTSFGVLAKIAHDGVIARQTAKRENLSPASRCSTQGDPPKPLPIPGPGRFTEPLANTQ